MMFLYSHYGLSVESTVNYNATDPPGHLSVVQRAFLVSDGVDPETHSHSRNLRNGSSV